jgi:FAM192A/Fyv6, N-terminal domain
MLNLACLVSSWTSHFCVQLSYKTEQLEDEEEHKKRLAKEKAAHSRTLWEQLEEQKEKKKEEYDAVTKQIFAPPKGLDEEEVAYLEGVAAKAKSKERARAEEEERELAAFGKK